MRLGIFSFFGVVLLLLCPVHPVTAQTAITVPQFSPPNVQNLHPLTKLLELPRFVNRDRVELYPGAANDPAKRDQLRKFLSGRGDGLNLTQPQTSASGGECAHILIYKAPNFDSQIVANNSRPIDTNMPRLQGLPSCQADIRNAVIRLQFAPFEKPDRNGLLIPKP